MSARSRVMPLLKEANDALRAGDVAKASASSARACEEAPEMYECWVMRGKVHCAMEEFPEAIAAYERGQKMNEDHPAAARGLRETFAASGDVDGRLRALDRLVEIYAKTGETDKVVEFLSEASEVAREAGDWRRAHRTSAALAGEPTASEETRARAVRERCDAALEIRDERARVAGRAAVDALRSTTIASRLDEEAAFTAAERRALGVDDDFTEELLRSLHAWLDSGEAKEKFDARAHTAILARLDARLQASLSSSLSSELDVKLRARELLAEATSLVNRFGNEAMAFAAKMAMEIVAALEIGLDVEEDGWDADAQEQDPDDETATDFARRCSAFKTNAIADAWLMLRETRRSGAFAHSCRPPNLPRDAKGLLSESARDALLQALTANDPGNGSSASLALGWLALAESMLVGGERSDMHALQASTAAIKIVAGDLNSSALPKTSRRCAVVNAEAMMRSGAFKNAAAAFDALEGPRAMRGAAVCAEYAHPPECERAIDILSSAAEAYPNCPRVRVELGWLLSTAGPIDRRVEALEILERACGSVANTPLSTATPADASARLGIARWRVTSAPSAKGPGSAHEALLLGAAGESAHRSAAFAHLGLVCAANGDDTRAQKCRARALQLDPADPTAGPATFADALRDGDDAHATAVCRRALETDSRCFWAASRLAPMCARAGDHDGAVVALQAVLRVTPNDASTWEALGASYNALGRHSAALKAFEHALKLSDAAGDGVREYAAAQTGFIHLALGSASDAINSYEKALSDGVDRVAALCGLASAQSSYAKDALRWGAIGRAAVSIRSAEAAASRALSAMGESATETAWKLLGDVRCLASRINDPALAHDAKAMLAFRRSAAKGAVEAYEKALSLKRDVGARWRDAAAALRFEADVLRLSGEDDGARACDAKSLEYVREYARCDPGDPHVWLALAFALDDSHASSGIERRITALSRAVALDPTYADAWTALGRLHLSTGDIAGATRALDSARIADPSSGEAWTATAALHIAEGRLDEGRGAFRMAAALGAGAEADLGCALTACASDNAKDARNAYAAARRAIERLPRDPTAAVALALCAESRGLLLEAKRSASEAVTLADAASLSPGDPSVTCALGVGMNFSLVREVANACLERIASRRDVAADASNFVSGLEEPGEDIEQAIDRWTVLAGEHSDIEAYRDVLTRVSSLSSNHARVLAGAENCLIASPNGDHRVQAARALGAAACLLNATPVTCGTSADDTNALGTRAMRLVASAAMLDPSSVSCVDAVTIAVNRRHGIVDVGDDTVTNARFSALKSALSKRESGDFAGAESLARDIAKDDSAPIAAASAARIILASSLISRAARDADKGPAKEAGKVLGKIPLEGASPSVISLSRELLDAVAGA